MVGLANDDGGLGGGWCREADIPQILSWVSGARSLSGIAGEVVATGLGGHNRKYLPFVFGDFGPVKQLLLSCNILRINRHTANGHSKIPS